MCLRDMGTDITETECASSLSVVDSLSRLIGSLNSRLGFWSRCRLASDIVLLCASGDNKHC